MFCFYGYKKEKQWGAMSAPVRIAVVFDNIAGMHIVLRKPKESFLNGSY